FGTHTGTVAAASDWGAAMQVMKVRPSHPRSYEHVAHESGIPTFFLPLRRDADAGLREALIPDRLERASAVIYRPDTELQSHCFQASRPRRFEGWTWSDQSPAATPVGEGPRKALASPPDTFPSGV